MEREYLQYYVQQGRGMQVYAGHEFQSGSGFFGRLIKGGIMPLVRKVLPFLKETALDTAGDFVDNMKSGDNFSSAIKKTAKRTVKKVIDAIDPQQQGSGCKRPRRQSNKRKRSNSTKRAKPRRKTANNATKRRSRSRSKVTKSRNRTLAAAGPGTTLF